MSVSRREMGRTFDASEHTVVRLQCPDGHVSEIPVHECAVVLDGTDAARVEYRCDACGGGVDQPALASHLRLLAACGSQLAASPAVIAAAADLEP